ncbi:hypothetical protein N0V87_010430 [Didymella glomerata]|uniref:PD-(D/E)XK nuclease-like domain-containing protein n=1 Tax=Didymella glomerata TaxID=749621 RepID=A0A9W8WPF1_9PLEO|nr:hypothetical protein N0V87_010430 [Didymella glomerata]
MQDILAKTEDYKNCPRKEYAWNGSVHTPILNAAAKTLHGIEAGNITIVRPDLRWVAKEDVDPAGKMVDFAMVVKDALILTSSVRQKLALEAASAGLGASSFASINHTVDSYAPLQLAPIAVSIENYGTTYTGVSYCETSDTGLNENHIEVVNNWPSRHTKIGTKEKVPSEIAYSPDGAQWGSLIPPNVPRHMWTKLQLDRLQTGEAAEVIKEQQLSAQSLNKQPVDIIADFLQHVKDHVLKTLDEEYRREAGFNNTCFPFLKKTPLTTEPEAAAIYTIKTLRGTTQDQRLAVDDGFVICDMGGGTVDLISYRVAELQPTIVEEATVGTGDQCGGSFIDRAFIQWLERRLGATHFFKIAGCHSEDMPRTSLTPKLGRMVQDFILEAKTGFSGNETNFLRLPAPLNAIEEDAARGISDGEILITPEDMIKMFEPPIRKTCELIDGQIKQAQQTSKVKLKYLFMVGGFSESPYVYSKIKEFVETKGLKTIRPAYAWSAVVRGAAAKGLQGDGHLPIRNRKCRRHYAG